MSEDRSKCVLDSPAATEAVQFLYDLRYKHKVAASSDNAEQNAALNAFVQGHIAMYTAPDLFLREVVGFLEDAESNNSEGG